MVTEKSGIYSDLDKREKSIVNPEVLFEQCNLYDENGILIKDQSNYKGVARAAVTDGRIVTLNGKNVYIQPVIFSYWITNENGSFSEINVNRNMVLKSLSSFVKPYASYYKDTLGENWSLKDVENMLISLYADSRNPLRDFNSGVGEYFLVSYATDLETKEVTPTGFFGSRVKPYNGGLQLFDGELFVLPEYQKLGIGTDLIKTMLIYAKSRGIDYFDAITYDNGEGHPISMWKSNGAQISDLIPIEGEIQDMINKMQDKNNKSPK